MGKNNRGPCIPDCPDRTRGEIPGCHSYCERYLEWKAKRYEEKGRELKGRSEQSDARGFLVERARAVRKRNKR